VRPDAFDRVESDNIDHGAVNQGSPPVHEPRSWTSIPR
jgi:hypothetical protein